MFPHTYDYFDTVLRTPPIHLTYTFLTVTGAGNIVNLAMSCELGFTIPGEETVLSIQDLRKRCESDPSISLREQLKGGKMKIQWPHTRPAPTGHVRTKLIHDRMHKKQIQNLAHEAPTKSLTNLSAIFTMIITIPAVAFSLYMILRWFKVSKTKSKIIGLLGGLASFFVELLLTIIDNWKTEKREEVMVKLATSLHEKRRKKQE